MSPKAGYNVMKCPHCRRQHSSIFAAETCCLFAPKQPTGWCSWCGRDCPTTFCSHPCAIAFQHDVLASRERPSTTWCAWCGKDCKGEFCGKVCERQFKKDIAASATAA